MSDVNMSPLASSAYLVLDVIIIAFGRADVLIARNYLRRRRAYKDLRLA